MRSMGQKIPDESRTAQKTVALYRKVIKMRKDRRGDGGSPGQKSRDGSITHVCRWFSGGRFAMIPPGPLQATRWKGGNHVLLVTRGTRVTGHPGWIARPDVSDPKEGFETDFNTRHMGEPALK